MFLADFIEYFLDLFIREDLDRAVLVCDAKLLPIQVPLGAAAMIVGTLTLVL